jgi:thioredoxin reductase (NADPH)
MAHDDLRTRYPEANLRLDQEHLRVVEKFADRKSFKDGETIIEAGTRDPNFYVIRSGEVEVLEYSTGRPRAIWKSYPQELLGDVSFLSGRASQLTRVARGEVEVFEISPENLRRIIDEEPKLGNVILATLITRIQIMRDLHLTPLQVIGSRFSADAFRIRDFLGKNRVSFTWIDMEGHPGADELLERLGVREAETPVVVCRNDWVLRNPLNRELAEKLGIFTGPKEEMYDLAIVGAGPAGLTAAVYGSSEGLRTIVLERTAPGGQAGTSSRIENYPGFPTGVSGDDLAARVALQAQKFGAEISTPCEVRKLDFLNGYPIVYLEDGKTVFSKSLLIASGASYRRLEVHNCEKFEGVGLYYAATPVEAQMCSDSEVIVVGGANSAGQAAVFLAEHTCKVLLLIRGDDLSKNMSRYLARRIEQTKNIQVLTHTEIAQMVGEGHLEWVEIKNHQTDEARWVPTTAVFTFIGAVPHTNWLPEGIEIDAKGFVKTGLAVTNSPFWSMERPPFFLETSHPGVFAAGDVRSGSMKRVASAVGEGAMSVAFVHEYFKCQGV